MAVMIEISSAQNPRYKTWLRLLDSRGIKKHEQALVAGRKIVGEVLASHADRVEGIILRQGGETLSQETPEGCPIYVLPGDMFAALDIYGIRGPILLVSAPPLVEWDQTLAPGLTVFLPFQNPINLGTTIRSAAAFGASVVLMQEAATPYLPKALRAAGPAVFQVPVFRGPDMETLAGVKGLPLFALSPKGKEIFSFPFSDYPSLGLVGGMEGPGLDSYWPEDMRLSIPMDSRVESLNASVAMGIAMACQLAAR